MQKNHFRRKCISSVTKWLNIINAKHCISSNRRKIHSYEWWYTAKRADDIHAKAWWYTKPAVWIKKVVSKWYDFFGADDGIWTHTSCNTGTWNQRVCRSATSAFYSFVLYFYTGRTPEAVLTIEFGSFSIFRNLYKNAFLRIYFLYGIFLSFRNFTN